MPNRTYRCPDCGLVATVALAPDEWDAEPPECPRCAGAAVHQVFTPPGILTNRTRAARIAERVAEAQIQHSQDTGIKAAEDALAAENWRREATRIVEQAREQNLLQPVVSETGVGKTEQMPLRSPAVDAAVAWGKAQRAAGEDSPVERLVSGIRDGSVPDVWSAFRRNCHQVT